MPFNPVYWSKAFTLTTASAMVYPIVLTGSYALFPSLKRHSSFAMTLWVFCFLIYYLTLIQTIRRWRLQYGLLKADQPRKRLSTKEMNIWKARSMISLTARAAAIFLSASDAKEKPWLRPTMKAMPDAAYFLHVHAFSVVMDGLFYVVHRSMHSNRFLFKHIHSKHHTHHNPQPISAMEDSMPEKLFNSFGQVYLAALIVPMSFWHLHFTIYAIFLAEILGHSGLCAAMSPPYTPLLDVMGLSITIEAHDLHHRIVRHNFGKQTLVWDKMFGTFHESLETGDGKSSDSESSDDEGHHHHHHHSAELEDFDF